MRYVEQLFNWLSKHWHVGILGGFTSAFLTTPLYNMALWIVLPTTSTVEAAAGVIKFAGITVGLGIAIVTFAIKLLEWFMKWKEFKTKMKE